MRIDVIIESNTPPDEVTRLGRLAEDVGLGGVWVANTVNGRDAFVNFSPLAQHSRRLRMGPIAVSPQELHPFKMAVSLLSLNELSRGRAQIVVGGGGGTAEAMALKPHRQVRAVRECAEILALAAAGQPGSYTGELYPMHWLDTSWVTQPPPRVYIGANGPQMLKSAARYADGIMVSDFTSGRIRWTRDIIDARLRERGLDVARFPLSNFWAWHVKESAEAARREARIWLCVRGTIYPDYIRDVLDEDEARLVLDNLQAFQQAYFNKTPVIDGVPDAIVDKLVDAGVSASAVADIDREVERLRGFKAAGLTEIALKLYADPGAAIQVIGRHLVGRV